VPNKKSERPRLREYLRSLNTVLFLLLHGIRKFFEYTWIARRNKRGLNSARGRSTRDFLPRKRLGAHRGARWEAERRKERNAAVKMSVSLVGATRGGSLGRLDPRWKNPLTLLGITDRFSDELRVCGASEWTEMPLMLPRAFRAARTHCARRHAQCAAISPRFRCSLPLITKIRVNESENTSAMYRQRGKEKGEKEMPVYSFFFSRYVDYDKRRRCARANMRVANNATLSLRSHDSWKREYPRSATSASMRDANSIDHSASEDSLDLSGCRRVCSLINS